jgi:hypothetical protein
VGKKRILLGFVKAVNLVDENDGPSAILARPFRFSHDLLDFFDPGEDGAKFDKFRPGHAGDYFRECGFAGTGRSPKDKGANVVALDLGAQGFAWSNEVLLADILVEGARPHTIGKRAALIAWIIAAGNGLKKTHESRFTPVTDFVVRRWLLA